MVKMIYEINEKYYIEIVNYIDFLVFNFQLFYKNIYVYCIMFNYYIYICKYVVLYEFKEQ